ncbi:amino acid permease [Aneurinibacillus aneurinilyticus]|nr:amino acid permease [Aneurinibacillus aneurinilyticus]MED0706584.1 amino acid permease [Aneurinibacillus aneurinilyticus]MED0725599.1 amino acid permease [Aneurinibacillus aneurinilyticus]MED0734760.1 amino acid permease [Aneurinibacillus aneurinilyticus]MED0739930.1 amino acid permease [Aneurinibacillus aneurinilyticus]
MLASFFKKHQVSSCKGTFYMSKRNQHIDNDAAHLASRGPAFIWSWPVVFIGQFLVALTMAEVASHFPIAGSIYQWSKHLVSSTYAWFAGCICSARIYKGRPRIDYIKQ